MIVYICISKPTIICLDQTRIGQSPNSPSYVPYWLDLDRKPLDYFRLLEYSMYTKGSYVAQLGHFQKMQVSYKGLVYLIRKHQ